LRRGDINILEHAAHEESEKALWKHYAGVCTELIRDVTSMSRSTFVLSYANEALTSTGAIAGYQRSEGNIKILEHAAHAGDEKALWEHLGRVLAQKLFRAGIRADCQNRCPLVLRTPCKTQLCDGICSPARLWRHHACISIHKLAIKFMLAHKRPWLPNRHALIVTAPSNA